MKEVEPLLALRAFVAKYPTQLEAARALAISPPTLSDLLLGRRPFSARVLDALGLRTAVVARGK